MFTEDCEKKATIRLAAFLVMGFIVFLTMDLVSTATVHSGAIGPHRQAQSRAPKKATKPAAPKKPRVDYSQFSHDTHITLQKLSCDSCHKFPTKNWKEVRQGEAAFPDVAEFPEHSSCLNCHRAQFFARERPAPAICSNCHVSVTPRDTTRFLFPSLGDITDPKLKAREFVSEFRVGFSHDKHVDVVGFNQPGFTQDRVAHFIAVAWQTGAQKKPEQPKSCPVCHQTYQPQGDSSEEYVTTPPKNLGDAFWLKKGTFKTIPNSHTVCFTCHNTDAGIAPAPSECNACHKLAGPPTVLKTDFDPKLVETIGVKDKTILTAWPGRSSSGTFRHEGGEHPDVNCNQCHNISVMNTLDVKTMVVPVRSCGGAEGCHVTATTDDGGALNYEIDQKKANPTYVCTKCHISFGQHEVPVTHVQAMPTPKPAVARVGWKPR